MAGDGLAHQGPVQALARVDEGRWELEAACGGNRGEGGQVGVMCCLS